MDWKIIVNDDIQSQHIRCHTLQPGDKIKDLVSSFRKAFAKALVLVNTQNNYTLSPELTEGLERSSFPVVIVTQSDGTSLNEFLERHFGQDVVARLDTVSMVVPAQQSQQPPSEVLPGKDATGVSKDKKSTSETTGITANIRVLLLQLSHQLSAVNTTVLHVYCILLTRFSRAKNFASGA